MPLTRPQAGILGAATLSTGSVSINTGVPILENTRVIEFNYSITTGSNAMSIGAIRISTGTTVTVPVGSTWTII
jgi:hypothetical protein